VTTSTPPGWYPDPGHAGAGPAPERWWDGERWSEHTRGSGLGPVPPPPVPPPSKGSKVPLIAGISAAVVIVAALVVGGVMIAGGSGGSCAEAAACLPPSPKPTPSRHSASPSPSSPDDPGTDEAGKPAHGVVLPLPGDWQRNGSMIGTGPYKCPGDTSLTCLRGGAAIVVAADPGATDPKAVAEDDVKWYARTSYDKKAYGGITGHEVVEAGPVEVAGQDGYRVRWKIENTIGPDAYVESVAFPHPDGSGRMLVADLSVDIADDAPPPTVMDKIVAGIHEGELPADGSGDDGNSKSV
jgi:hypothetical protein